MPADRIPCAIVGCGPRAEGHVRAIRRSDSFELVAGCDVDAGAAARFAAGNDVLTRDSVEALATALGPRLHDALVVVATPPRVRSAVVDGLCRLRPAGLLVEKPLACSWDDVEAIVAAAASTGTPLFVNHQLRLLPGMARVAAMVAGGDLGAVTTVYAASRASWQEHGPHLVDLVGAVLGGGPSWRWARAAAEPASDRHDLSTVGHLFGTVELESGAHVLFECGPDARRWEGLPNPWHQMGFEVVAERGLVSFALNRGWNVHGPGGAWSQAYVHDDEDDGSQVRLLGEVATALSTGRPGPAAVGSQWEAVALQHALPMAAARRGRVTGDELVGAAGFEVAS